MKSLLSFALSLAAILALVPPAPAAELGDAAKPLQIAVWVKGKPVDLAASKGKQIVVVEFWATWCPPCRASIPHLTKMQKKFKDVAFVGISAEVAATVKKFVAKMGNKMNYTVAVDDNKKTSAAYMEAFGIDTIPHAFIVDKGGRIVWHGN
ncbi:MAG: TlpA family protein disulfide reductase, partial [Verrucomicrobia bacterium]|nr:TlpA family protein disulfide reductase [Verrucomicrobiota bacterium]